MIQIIFDKYMDTLLYMCGVLCVVCQGAFSCTLQDFLLEGTFFFFFSPLPFIQS